MVDILIRIGINAVALALAIKLLGPVGVEFTGDWPQLIALAIIFGVVNGLIRPIVKLLALPLTIATFGLIGILINTAMVVLAAWLGDQMGLGLTLGGWPADGRIDIDTIVAALAVAIVISVVSIAVSMLRKVVPGT
jgi:putative membrane protein